MTQRTPNQQLPYTLLQGDALEQLQTLASESVHAVITDPPYGLAPKLDVEAMLYAWLKGETFVNDYDGYDGEVWDNSVPGPELWRQTFRLLVPGGYVLAFAAARTVGSTTMALQLAGFEVRDLLHWVYAPGRCSRDQSLAAAQLGDTDLMPRVTAMRPTLQPGHEPIIVARKPFDEPGTTVLDNFYDYGVGVINHGAITGAASAIASNVWLVHELNCTAQRCECQVNNSGAASHGTHIFPSRYLPDRSLNVSKPGKSERPVADDGTTHKTVKPLALMRTLVEAVTLPGQVVLDPFLGSGTTMEATLLSGRQSVGCEMNPEFIPLIHQRIRRVYSNV
jgi:site-specific DNA-methyltransferase (adenine-specific)